MTARRTGFAIVLMVVASLAPVANAWAGTISVPDSFGTPGPLAVTPAGTLYVASGQDLYRLTGSRLAPFATVGETIESAVAGANGAIYLGGNRALMSVSPDGKVATIANLQVAGLGSGPTGTIYVVTNSAITRLLGRTLEVVANAARFDGLRGVPSVHGAVLGLGNVAADGKGDLYVSGSGAGFNLYELTAAGRARFISPFRGANGKPAPLTIGPGGVVYGEWQNSIEVADGSGTSGFQGFSVGTVSGVSGIFLPAFIAASMRPGSPLYADSTGGNGFGGSGIIAIGAGHRIVTLWSRPQ